MHCVKCGSDHLSEFSSEVAIHFSGRENRGKPHVFLFPAVLVCLDCGFSDFGIAEPELGRIAREASLPPKNTPLSVISET